MHQEMLPLAYYAIGALFAVLAMKYAAKLYMHSSMDLIAIRRIEGGLYEMDLVHDGVPLSVVGKGQDWRLTETNQPLTDFLRGSVYAVWLRHHKKAQPSQ